MVPGMIVVLDGYYAFTRTVRVLVWSIMIPVVLVVVLLLAVILTVAVTHHLLFTIRQGHWIIAIQMTRIIWDMPHCVFIRKFPWHQRHPKTIPNGRRNHPRYCYGLVFYYKKLPISVRVTISSRGMNHSTMPIARIRITRKEWNTRTTKWMVPMHWEVQWRVVVVEEEWIWPCHFKTIVAVWKFGNKSSRHKDGKWKTLFLPLRRPHNDITNSSNNNNNNNKWRNTMMTKNYNHNIENLQSSNNNYRDRNLILPWTMMHLWWQMWYRWALILILLVVGTWLGMSYNTNTIMQLVLIIVILRIGP